MTIYIPDLQTGNKIALNGDFSGWTHYRLQLVSNYTNKELENSLFEWVYELWLDSSNERYTEWTLTSILPVPAAGQYQGFYTYNLYGTMTDADRQDPFVPEDWSLLYNGLCKLVQTNQTGKLGNIQYVSPDDRAESYVIYNP